MIPEETWRDLGPDLGSEFKARLEEDLTEVLSRRYFRFRSEAEWESVKLEVSGHVAAFFEALVATDGAWRDLWVDYLAGEGETIMDATKVRSLGVDPRHVAQYWAVALQTIGKFDLAALLGEAGFDPALASYEALDELWSLSGTLLGHVAARGFDVLRANPYAPAYALYEAGLRPHFFADEGFVLHVPLADRRGRRLSRYLWRNGGLQPVGERGTV